MPSRAFDSAAEASEGAEQPSSRRAGVPLTSHGYEGAAWVGEPPTTHAFSAEVRVVNLARLGKRARHLAMSEAARSQR